MKGELNLKEIQNENKKKKEKKFFVDSFFFVDQHI